MRIRHRHTKRLNYERLFARHFDTIVIMQLLTAGLRLKNRKCVVVGSGSQTLELAQQLYKQQAQVTLICRTPPTQNTAGLQIRQGVFSAADLDDCWLVVAGSDSAEENAAITDICNQRQRFCLCIDDQANSSWLAPPEPEAPHTIPDSQAGNSLSENTSAGMVSLVGAGPGDPQLLTLRALQLIQTADAIVYDRLVSDPILKLCNPAAKYIYAGKARADHTLPQESINELLVDLALQYRRVVRLKGGDPFVFGRGGEEIETLADRQIPFQVVPGITAASGCSAFAGIPLTHRDHAQSCIFVTGHLRNGQINLDWQHLVAPHQTIVVYMGLTGLEMICESLIKHGKSAQTPAALVQQGTKPQQRVFTSTLEKLPQLIAQNDVTAPTLLIIGGVVTLREKLGWFNL